VPDDPGPATDRKSDEWEARWRDFCAHLEHTGQTVLRAAPDDDLDRAEGLRYVGRIARHALQRFIEEWDPSAPVLGGLPKLGGDNPDYLYTGATISAAFEYRLRGRLGEASYIGFGSYSGEVGTAEGLRLSGYLDGADIERDDQGRFEIVISRDEHATNWLPIEADTTQLMVRELLLDRRRQHAAEFELEIFGGPVPDAPLVPEDYARRLRSAGVYVEGAIDQFLEWSASFASRPNHVGPIDPALASAAQGDPHTHYYGGYYRLAEGELLVIDFTPPACEYWNLQLCNHWLESLDRPQHQISLNHGNAAKADDGAVRVVIGNETPPPTHSGPPLNWLDTAGHDRGCMIFRQVGTPTPCTPTCRVMRRGELAGPQT